MAPHGSQTVQRNRRDQREIRSQYAVYGAPTPEGNTAPQRLKRARFRTHLPVRLEFPSGWQRFQRSGGLGCAGPRSPAAPQVPEFARAAELGIGRNQPAACFRQRQVNCLADARIVRRLARPLSIRCGGSSVYFVRDFGLCYQACWSFFPATRVRPRELPDLWTAHYKGTRFLDFVDCAMKRKMLPSGEAEWPETLRDGQRRNGWQKRRNRCSQLADRILSHRSSSSRARISESFAAS